MVALERVLRRVGGWLVTSIFRISERKSGEPWWNTCTGSTFTRVGANEMLFGRTRCLDFVEEVGPSWMNGLISGNLSVKPAGCGDKVGA